MKIGTINILTKSFGFKMSTYTSIRIKFHMAKFAIVGTHATTIPLIECAHGSYRLTRHIMTFSACFIGA